MKRYIPLLFLSTLISAESYVDYCLEKYPPKEKPSELRQCLNDFSDFNDSKPSKETKTPTKEISENVSRYDVLHPKTKMNFNNNQLKDLKRIYSEFINAKDNKVFAIEVNRSSLEPVDIYDFCTDSQSIEKATQCALEKCNASIQSQNICLPQYANDEFVFLEAQNYVRENPNLFPIKNIQKQYSQNNQRQTPNWGNFARWGANYFGNQARPTTSVCNFKNFEGQIITGDCRNNSINSGGEIYWKVR